MEKIIYIKLFIF